MVMQYSAFSCKLYHGLEINEEWLADKSRFSCDGLRRQRLLVPMLMRSTRGTHTWQLVKSTWEEALASIGSRLVEVGRSGARNAVAGLAGPFADAEALTALRDLVHLFDSELICTEEKFPANSTDLRANYLFSGLIAGIDSADLVLLIGTNPRFEAPLLNARLRKAWVHNDLEIAMVGDPVDLTYEYDHLGSFPDILEQIASGSHPFSHVSNF
ncbi:unnamed protein product [Protopolystoma xenopodis]|uniref:NADH-ubiquinone oxidoreductase 75 kDa subunit, mitochondrial n=1 Tax=Protopolystoma xenopodis TaxID=117903 RepID=A0A3S5CH18_9PLAT|nr:unnamed protein product [Protopolystoma xenopodis]